MSDKVIPFPPMKEVNDLAKLVKALQDDDERSLSLAWKPGEEISIKYDCLSIEELVGALEIVKLRLINQSYNTADD